MDLPSADAILIRPSSLMSILAPVFSTISRMTLPPEPMTSRILSTGICMVSMRGACSPSSARGAVSALFLRSRVRARPSPAWASRRVPAELVARAGERLVRLLEDVGAALPGLVERDPHDLFGDARDLDVHLE